MRALRILLIVVVILGGLFVIADRVAVNFAEDEVAEKLQSSEGLAATPEVSIKGFPFLTQVASGELDETEVGIEDYEAATGTEGDTIRIDDIKASFKDVEFSGDYSSATAATASGTATIAYDQLLKAAKSEPTEIFTGVTARVVGLSDGGNGKIKVKIEVSALGATQTYDVLSTVTVDGDQVKVHADNLPDLAVELADGTMRKITDFQQTVDDLPGGVRIDKVEGAKEGVEITVKGSNVELAG